MKIVILLSVVMMLIAKGLVSRLRVMVLEDPKVNPLLLNPAPGDQAPNFLNVEIEPGVLANFNVQLGTPSKQIEILDGVLRVPIFRGKNPEPNAWTRVIIPKQGDYLAVIVRSAGGKNMTWKNVRTYLFEDKDGIAPKGSFRVLNASEKGLAFKVGDLKPQELKSGGSSSLPHPEEDMELKMAQKDEKGRYKMILRNRLGDRKKNVRTSYFVYQDGNSRVKSLLYTEKVKAPKG